MTGPRGATVKSVKTVKVGSRRRDCQTALPALVRNPVIPRLRRTPTLDEAAPGLDRCEVGNLAIHTYE